VHDFFVTGQLPKAPLILCIHPRALGSALVVYREGRIPQLLSGLPQILEKHSEKPLIWLDYSPSSSQTLHDNK